MNKFHARKVQMDGLTFDSKAEARRWRVLCVLQDAGTIADLKRQTVFELIPRQTDEAGRVLERACTYKADFTYWQGGHFVVEDVKSRATRTPEYRIKKKLMLQVHGIRITEVDG